MFEKATRLKVRFNTQNGVLTVEDLWDLPLDSKVKASLNTIAIGLNKEIKESGEESFVGTSKANPITVLKFEIVKHIISVRLAEADEKAKARAKAEQKETIGKLIAEKEQEGLKSMSLDELKKLYNA